MPRRRKITTGENGTAELLRPYPQRRWVPKAEVLEFLRTAAPDPAFIDDIAELGELKDLTSPRER